MFWYLLAGALHLVRDRGRYARFDVIDTDFSIRPGCSAVRLAPALDPDVLTIIGGDIYDPSKCSSPHNSALMRRINHFLIESAARVIAISSDTKRRAREYYGVTRAIRVINYGFRPCPPSGPTGEGQPAAPPHRSRYQLISVWSAVERKGFDHLVRAMRELPDDVGLWIVGDGRSRRSSRISPAGKAWRTRGATRLPHPRGDPRAAAPGRLLCALFLHEGLGIGCRRAWTPGFPWSPRTTADRWT